MKDPHHLSRKDQERRTVVPDESTLAQASARSGEPEAASLGLGRSPLVPRRPVLLIGRFEFLHFFIGQFEVECSDCLR